MVERNWIKLRGIVCQGHQVASGKAGDNPYPEGTIKMQIPFFQALGLDLSSLFPGTLNISIHPHTFEVIKPQYTFKNVSWAEGYPPEDFSFSSCQLTFNLRTYKAWIYYPHPETKIGHFQNPSILEILAPGIEGIAYNDSVDIDINSEEIAVR